MEIYSALPRWCRQRRTRRRAGIVNIRQEIEGYPLLYGHEESSSKSTTASVAQNCDSLSRNQDEVSDASLKQCSATSFEQTHRVISQSLERTVCNAGSVSEPSDVSYNGPSVQLMDDSIYALSNSSVMRNESSVQERGKRKRKRKLQFDDLYYAKEPRIRGRRLKIMRQLGLIAPIGSTFARTKP